MTDDSSLRSTVAVFALRVLGTAVGLFVVLAIATGFPFRFVPVVFVLVIGLIAAAVAELFVAAGTRVASRGETGS